jgi:hypothetical protein
MICHSHEIQGKTQAVCAREVGGTFLVILMAGVFGQPVFITFLKGLIYYNYYIYNISIILTPNHMKSRGEKIKTCFTYYLSWRISAMN